MEYGVWSHACMQVRRPCGEPPDDGIGAEPWAGVPSVSLRGSSDSRRTAAPATAADI
ncbi:hypothetical protein BC567DRAFT_230866 [Phyllosticta citribraziliensis]